MLAVWLPSNSGISFRVRARTRVHAYVSVCCVSVRACVRACMCLLQRPSIKHLVTGVSSVCVTKSVSFYSFLLQVQLFIPGVCGEMWQKQDLRWKASTVVDSFVSNSVRRSREWSRNAMQQQTALEYYTRSCHVSGISSDQAHREWSYHSGHSCLSVWEGSGDCFVNIPCWRGRFAWRLTLKFENYFRRLLWVSSDLAVGLLKKRHSGWGPACAVQHGCVCVCCAKCAMVTLSN